MLEERLSEHEGRTCLLAILTNNVKERRQQQIQETFKWMVSLLSWYWWRWRLASVGCEEYKILLVTRKPFPSLKYPNFFLRRLLFQAEHENLKITAHSVIENSSAVFPNEITPSVWICSGVTVAEGNWAQSVGGERMRWRRSRRERMQ